MDEFMNDDDGTWVITKIKYSIFTQIFGKYTKTISQSEHCLPELEIQAGFSKFSGFSKTVVSISINSVFNFYFSSVCTREYTRTGKSMDFTPQADDGVIREAVSHKLYRSEVNTSKQFGQTKLQLKLQLHPFILLNLDSTQIRYTIIWCS